MIDEDIPAEVPLKERVIVEYGFEEAEQEVCKAMLGQAFDLLDAKLNDDARNRLTGVKLEIGPGVTEGGGQALVDQNRILLDSDKVRLSLQQSEDFLVQEGYFNPGERTQVFPDIKDEPWSTLVYELVHETAHFFDEDMSLDLSPTQYPKAKEEKDGQPAGHEVFCESYVYWIADAPMDAEAKRIITAKVGKSD